MATDIYNHGPVEIDEEQFKTDLYDSLRTDWDIKSGTNHHGTTTVRGRAHNGRTEIIASMYPIHKRTTGWEVVYNVAVYCDDECLVSTGHDPSLKELIDRAVIDVRDIIGDLRGLIT